jgi:hypothetical protein
MPAAAKVFGLTACLAMAWSALPAQAVRLAQSPVRVAFLLEQAGPVRSMFDSLLGQRLREQGFDVVPPPVYDSLWLHFRDSVGGYYDPFTGRVVDSLFHVVQMRTRGTLRDGYGVQVITYALLDVLRLPFSGGKVEWFGASEESGGRGGLAGFVLGRTRGTIPGITLVVTAQDLEGRRLARRLGGIQLLEHIEGGEFVEVPRQQLFADQALMVRAVRHATDSLPELVQQGLHP